MCRSSLPGIWSTRMSPTHQGSPERVQSVIQRSHCYSRLQRVGATQGPFIRHVMTGSSGTCVLGIVRWNRCQVFGTPAQGEICTCRKKAPDSGIWDLYWPVASCVNAQKYQHQWCVCACTESCNTNAPSVTHYCLRGRWWDMAIPGGSWAWARPGSKKCSRNRHYIMQIIEKPFFSFLKDRGGPKKKDAEMRKFPLQGLCCCNCLTHLILTPANTSCLLKR